jgi:hypothetical protein
MKMRTTVVWAALVAVIFIALGACGDDDSAPSGGGAGSTTTVACPFDGSTGAQHAAGGPVPSVELTEVRPSRSGCIDNVSFTFSPALAASDVAYDGSSPVLRVRFTGATLGQGFSSGSTVPPTGLAYVQKIEVTSAPTGEVDWLFTLDRVRPFLISPDQDPAQLQVAIG